MPADFLYPTTREIQLINQTFLPRLEANRVVFQPGMFPIINDDVERLEWDQEDNFVGLQQARGLNGSPHRVRPTGAKRFSVEPGHYGEFIPIDEREITTRRAYGSYSGGPIDVGVLIARAQFRLLQRRLDRIEWIVWQLLLNGAFMVAAPNGAVVHVDSFTTQTFAAGISWATPATSTPMADLRAVKLLSRGYSVTFGSNSIALMNQVTANWLTQNLNPNDIFGRRGPGLTTINSPGMVSQLLIGDDLPNPSVYDEGYLNDQGAFTPFIPNGKVVLIGSRRDGVPVGQYRMTRNANNPGAAPGSYTRIVDDPNRIPRTIEVHDGHNGGPVIFYPSAIVVMTV